MLILSYPLFIFFPPFFFFNFTYKLAWAESHLSEVYDNDRL